MIRRSLQFCNISCKKFILFIKDLVFNFHLMRSLEVSIISSQVITHVALLISLFYFILLLLRDSSFAIHVLLFSYGTYLFVVLECFVFASRKTVTKAKSRPGMHGLSAWVKAPLTLWVASRAYCFSFTIVLCLTYTFNNNRVCQVRRII